MNVNSHGQSTAKLSTDSLPIDNYIQAKEEHMFYRQLAYSMIYCG